MKDSETNRTVTLERPGPDKNTFDNEILDLLIDNDGAKTCRLLSLLSTLTENDGQNVGNGDA